MPETQPAAIVTGGSRGIGRAIAERLARDGYAVTMTYRDREGSAKEVVTGIESAGGRAIAVRADLASASDIAAVFAAGDEAFGRLDALVLNAADVTKAPLTVISEEAWDRAFLINTRAAFLAYRQAAQRLGEGGRIVALSTGLTRDPGPEFAAYTASKAALEALTRSFAHEMGGRGVTVNVVQAGVTDTEGMLLERPVVEAIIGRTPLGRIGQPIDIAGVVSFLVSPDAGWITGELVRATGGLA